MEAGDMPQAKMMKIAFIGIGILAGVVGIAYAAKKIANVVKGKEGKKLVKSAGKEIKRSQLSFSPSDYQSMVATLYTAMKGAGTDYYAIERILKRLKTKSDWLKIVQVFGIKKVDVWYLPTFEGSIISWLQDELDEGEQVDINEILSKIGVGI